LSLEAIDSEARYVVPWRRRVDFGTQNRHGCCPIAYLAFRNSAATNVEAAFFGANILKIAHGGWFPLAIGAVLHVVPAGRPVGGFWPEFFTRIAIPIRRSSTKQ
jgi:hypothetical protein